jgi:adenylosuccinate synthase
VIEAPIDIVSTGPDRNETIVLRSPFTGWLLNIIC